VGAGVLAAGLSTVMLLGAGIAAADDRSTAGAGGGARRGSGRIPLGSAHGYVLPGPAPRLTLVDLIVLTVLESTTGLSSANCAADPDEMGRRRRRKPSFNGKLHTKHGVIS
jgi:hypothetical protein